MPEWTIADINQIPLREQNAQRFINAVDQVNNELNDTIHFEVSNLTQMALYNNPPQPDDLNDEYILEFMAFINPSINPRNAVVTESMRQLWRRIYQEKLNTIDYDDVESAFRTKIAVSLWVPNGSEAEAHELIETAVNYLVSLSSQCYGNMQAINELEVHVNERNQFYTSPLLFTFE